MSVLLMIPFTFTSLRKLGCAHRRGDLSFDCSHIGVTDNSVGIRVADENAHANSDVAGVGAIVHSG